MSQDNDLLSTYSSTLKRRSSETKEVQVVNKPRKMKLVKPRRVPNKTADYANSSLLVFPTDSLGITTEIKAALIRAGSKIGKDKRALALVQEVLDIGIKHIEARHAQALNRAPLARKVQNVPEEEEVQEEEPTVEVSYDDMLQALTEAGVKPESRKKKDVQAAYDALSEVSE